jgi:phytoene/squalene synthetase/2-polyprenyl-6-methoxyphenol hydroxylase-like FAD-dependent oxidoreductase
MRASRSSYDVAVIGAGPVGSATAIAFARQGARVVLLEADPRAARRFAGEWVHPTGIEVLDELRIGRLDGARPRTGYGFVIFPDDRSAPIEMPYGGGIALSAEHHAIVEAIRDAARDVDAIEFVTFAKTVGIEGNLLRCEDREGGGSFEVRADRIVGADGRASIVRTAMSLPERSTLLSYMAAVELHLPVGGDHELPCEGFGHVILGGPGPALFYRISDELVRGCLDVPVSFGARARTPAFLWDAFHPVLPPQLLPAFRAALARGPSGWAANRFRPRADFGKGQYALVGDAVGHVHPMTAIGITMGLLDARALARSDGDLEKYAHERRGYIPELLSNALYHCFRREDASATEVRRAMFRTLRASEAERKRTMQILAASDPRRRSFGSAFLKIAAQAIGTTVSETSKAGDWSRLGTALSQYGEWMQWPAAVAIPRRVSALYRGDSSATHPIPLLGKLIRAEPLAAPEDDERAHDAPEVPVHEAIERGNEVLLVELEEIARTMGTVPDAAIVGPGTRMMRAITASAMRPALAARMTIGRRRLAGEGIARLLELADWRSAELAELLLVLLDGTSWGDEPIVQLAEGVRALLECQTEHGGFATRMRGGLPRDHEGDLESTALACRAIDVVLRKRPGASDADLEGALARAGRWLRSRQADDGGWPAIGPFGGGGAPDPIVRTALAIEALIAIDANPGEPAIRRGCKWLVGKSADWSEAREPIVAAHAVEALCAARAASQECVSSGVRALARVISVGIVEDDQVPAWELASAIALALGSYEARRAERPLLSRTRAKRGAAGSGAASESEPSAPIAEVDAQDWAFCKQALAEVSRTFSRPIALLPPKLEVAVTLGYLLCRIADTVEDHPAVELAAKDRLFRLFLEVLEKGADPEEFETAFREIQGEDPELSLARRTSIVMRVFGAQSARTRDACVRWVSEMARGMSLYSHRREGHDGFMALVTNQDLERYCYYVAGTVGHLLTDLFVEEIGQSAGSELELRLREDAESFAQGLQMVNILKDVTDDRERRVSFIPRTAVARQRLTIETLCDADVRARAHAAVAPLFDIARKHLDAALRYALASPPAQTGIRLFCLLPLWMAARTLVIARGNDGMFVPGAPVKIGREEVESIIAECVRYASDDDALRARYARLYDPVEPIRRATSSLHGVSSSSSSSSSTSS